MIIFPYLLILLYKFFFFNCVKYHNYNKKLLEKLSIKNIYHILFGLRIKYKRHYLYCKFYYFILYQKQDNIIK